MGGTRTDAAKVVGVFQGYSNAAVTANLYLAETVALFPGRISAVKVRAETAGTGAGNTVVDLFVNSVSVWTTGADRPTLAATSTGEFTNKKPNRSSLQPGDRLAWQVVSVSTTGHARVSCAVSLEMP